MKIKYTYKSSELRKDYLDDKNHFLFDAFVLDMGIIDWKYIVNQQTGSVEHEYTFDSKESMTKFIMRYI